MSSTKVTLEIGRPSATRMFNSLFAGEFFHMVSSGGEIILDTVYKKITMSNGGSAAVQVVGTQSHVSYLAQTQPVQAITEVHVSVCS